MPDEVTPSSGQGPEGATASEAPTDFRAYAAWRATGELPAKDDTPAAAGTGADATETQAETVPDSEPENTQDAEENKERDEAGRKNRPGSRERKLERALAEVEELKRQVAEHAIRSVTPQEKPSQSAPAPGEPKLEDFQTLEAYNKALTRWTYAEIEREKQEAAEQAAKQEVKRKEQESWAKKVKAAQKAHADFAEVMDEIQLPMTPTVNDIRQSLLEEENGAEILYFLSTHPKELERIVALTPHSAVVAIGKLAASFDKSPASPENGKPRITGAPKPPPPSGKSSKTTSDSLDDPEVLRDFSRYERLRKAQLGRR